MLVVEAGRDHEFLTDVSQADDRAFPLFRGLHQIRLITRVYEPRLNRFVRPGFVRAPIYSGYVGSEILLIASKRRIPRVLSLQPLRQRDFSPQIPLR